MAIEFTRTTELSSEVLKSLSWGQGLYQLGFSLAFGMNVWQSFFGGVIAHKTLTRQQFGLLQSRIFPVFFSLSASLCYGLLSMWVFSHPDIFINYRNISNADVAQAYILAVTGLMHSANSFVIGPRTNQVMNDRHQQERLEKKSYSDPDISEDMKNLNKRFTVLHSISGLLALLGVFTLGFHGLWIANAGTRGY